MTGQDGSGYEREAALLDQKLIAIRQQQDSGAISIREGADARIDAMERHLETLKTLREAWSGAGGAVPS